MVTRRRNLLTGILAAVVLGVSGCATSNGLQSPTITQQPTTKAATPTNIAAEPLSPPVSRPLTVVGVSACNLVPESQLIALGLDPSTVEDHSNSDTANCRWFSGGRADIASLLLSNVRGLDSAYFVRESFPYFEPTEISGYPAIRTTSPDEWNTCHYMVGVGPDRSVGVSVDTLQGNPGKDNCTLVKNLLTAAIAELSAE